MPLVAGLVATGFYGLDEVAEILESPFGNDPNDIDLRDYGQNLLTDIELFYHGREMQLDTIFNDEVDVEFRSLMRQSTRERHAARMDSLRKHVSDTNLEKHLDMDP